VRLDAPETARHILEFGPLPVERSGPLGIVPKGGILELAPHFLETEQTSIVVKETSGDFRDAAQARRDVGEAPPPPACSQRGTRAFRTERFLRISGS